MLPDGFDEPGRDWQARIEALPPSLARRLAARAAAAPLFAHAYAFHLNFRFGGFAPADLLDVAQAEGLAGIKIHVEDGEERCLLAMPPAARAAFGEQARRLGLAVHVETSTTEEAGLAAAVAVARDVGATSLRCYPRYAGRLLTILPRVITDLGRLEALDPGGTLRFTLEQHEDLTSAELAGIVEAVGSPRLSLLFDFGNMVNAYETPLAALARQAAHVTEVHVKDCRVVPDGSGWAHEACPSGSGDIPMAALLVELLLLGEASPQVTAFGLEEEDGYRSPAFRFPDEGPDPVIPPREPSLTDPGSGPLKERLARERAAARAQTATIRAMLNAIAERALRRAAGVP